MFYVGYPKGLNVTDNNLAPRAYVDPNPQNKKAWKLYSKLGFVSKERPELLEKYETLNCICKLYIGY